MPNGPFLNDLTTKKEFLLKTFLSDERFVQLVTNQQDVQLPALDLRYKQVFPYGWIGDTVSIAKTFVCFDVDVPQIKTIAVKDCYLYIWVFAHKSLMPTKEGVRVDLLSSRIDWLLNGSTELGFGRLRLESCLRINPNEDYYGRVLKYYVQDWNRFGEKL